jgi:hypothetical protein
MVTRSTFDRRAIGLRAAGRRGRGRHRLGPLLEELEARVVLSTYWVTNTGDLNPDGSVVPGSLRVAINASNSNPGNNTIAFNIAGPGVQTIKPTSPLPAITDPVDIDGTSQPGYAGRDGSPLIEIDGSLAGSGANGLWIAEGGQGTTINALSVHGFGQYEIRIDASLGGNTVLQSWIGTNPATSDPGTPATGPGGILIQDSPGNTIGAIGNVGRNIISGNHAGAGIAIAGPGSHGNQIVGNNIGVGPNGSGAPGAYLSNTEGISIRAGAHDNQIGVPGGGNVISFNSFGVEIRDAGTSGNVLQSNIIGLMPDGITPFLGVEQLAGVFLWNGASDNQVGSSGAGNIISGNDFYGVHLMGVSGNRIYGNFIGPDITGNGIVHRFLPGNQEQRQSLGVRVQLGASDNQIGAPGQGNVISGNSTGVLLDQAGTSFNQVVQNAIGLAFNGSALGNSVDGVAIKDGATDNLVAQSGAGNYISSNGQAGVELSGPGVTRNVIDGNWIGLDDSGTASRPNGEGVLIHGGAHDNTIGLPNQGNVISGNSDVGITLSDMGTTGNRIQHNDIGTDPSGSHAIGNGSAGVILESGAAGNVVGGPQWSAGNVISGNAASGIALRFVGTSGNVVEGNFIGTNAGGTAPLPNGNNGINIYSGASENVIGGPAPGDGNLIGGNANNGVRIADNGLPAGLIADWKADGDALDALGRNNGTATNTTYVPGAYGQAFHFDGLSFPPGSSSPSAIQVPDSPDLKPANLSLFARVSFDTLDTPGASAPGLQYIIFKQNTRTTQFEGYSLQKVRTGTGDHFAFVISSKDGVQVVALSTTTIAVGQVYAVAATYDGTTMKLYVNGQLESTQSAGFALDYGTEPLWFATSGQSYYDGRFAGTLDEVSLYNRALDPEEIEDLTLVNGLGGNRVFRNAIGASFDATVKLANGADGVTIQDSTGNLVGDFRTPNSGNVIAGNNGRGLSISGTGSWYDSAMFNAIGTDVTGTVHQGNGLDGVLVSGGARLALIGGGSSTAGSFGNTIAYNGGKGVVVGYTPGDVASAITVSGNSIHDNTKIGIDLGNDGVTLNTPGSPHTGPNSFLSTPVITSAKASGGSTVIDATINSAPNITYDYIEFFASDAADPTGYGQGQTFLSRIFSVTTDANGNGSTSLTVPANLLGRFITATFNLNGETSEFSRAVAVVARVPMLTSVTPGSAPAGPTGLTIAGGDFDPGATVRFDGVAIPTTFISASALTATIPAGLTSYGPHTITVVNPSPGGGESNGLPFATTAAPTMVQAVGIGAAEGSPFTGVVATFSAPAGRISADHFRALVSWGDGQSGPAEVRSAGEGFVVVGTHRYTEEGTYPTSVEILGDDGASASAGGTATVQDAPIDAVGQAIVMSAAHEATPVVAAFEDANPKSFAGDFSATIGWGDGTVSPGRIQSQGAGFVVVGDHTYYNTATYPLRITIRDAGGGQAIATGSAVVQLAPLVGLPQAISVHGNKTFSGTVAIFTDPDPRVDPGFYSAVIDWGDGTSSVGTISGRNPFTVTGSHTYSPFTDVKSITVTITDPQGRTLTVVSRVADPAAKGRHLGPDHSGQRAGRAPAGHNRAGVTGVPHGPRSLLSEKQRHRST